MSSITIKEANERLPFAREDYHSIESGLFDLVVVCHVSSVAKGWDHDLKTGESLVDNPFYVGMKLALIHSEISEALEGARKKKMDDHLPDRSSVEVELADAVIRIAHLAGALGLDLPGAVLAKMQYNDRRADHDPANRAKEGGKAF